MTVENFPEIRTISSFDEIIPVRGIGSRTVDNLVEVAKRYGLNDMHDVVTSWIHLGENTKLTDVKGPTGETIGYRPEIKVDVNMGNSLKIQKGLTATMVLCFAIYLNDRFKVPWGSLYEQEGIFGATWANGYLTIDREATPPETYVNLMQIYMGKTREVQLWHIKQINELNKSIGLLKELDKKK